MLNIVHNNTDQLIRYEHIQRNPKNFDFHLHEECEIYFLLSGDVNYFIEKKIYPLKYGDLIVTNPHEIHKPSLQSDRIYERIILRFMPSKICAFNTPDFDLCHCFFNRPRGEQNRVSLNPRQIEELLQLFNKFDYISKTPFAAHDILMLSYIMEVLVYINLIYLNIPFQEEHINIPEKLSNILEYIDQNLERSLTLELLEKKFYINKFYLSKLFKNSIGSNLHEYIIFKRISKAKKLLSEGFNVTDTCIKCGFNDYSNFIKMFKKTMGVSPGRYKNQLTRHTTI